MSDLSYYEFVIANKIYSTKNTISLDDLMNSLGIYPEKVIEVIDNMMDKKYIKNEKKSISLTKIGLDIVSQYPVGKMINVDYIDAGNRYNIAINNMIHEHPLQYQYWFTGLTCETLLHVVVDLLYIKEPYMAFLGAPFLALYFNLVFPEWHLLIVDISQNVFNNIKDLVNDNVQFVNADMRYDTMQEELGYYDVVFIDPPFYVDYYAGFLKWATSMQKDDGLLFAVMFGSNIKENNIERKQITDLIAKDYTLIKTYNDILEYYVPRFEIKTYKELNLDSNISDWRHNTLGIFCKCKSNTNVESFYPKDYEWVEYIFGKKRIMVRKNAVDNTNIFIFRPLYNESNILKSVSRRNIDREKICLWTSDNEVYIASNSALEVIHTVLAEISMNGMLKKEIIRKMEVKYGSSEIHNLLSVINMLIREAENERA